MRRASTVLLSLIWLASQPCAWAAEVSFSPATGGGRFQGMVQSLQERRWKNVTRQGSDISCGTAALDTILRYQFGEQVSENTLVRAILKQVASEDVKKRGGFSLLDLKRVATSLGYRVQGYKLTLEQLATFGTPAIIAITVRGYKHFVVFRGMLGDRVILADPAFGNTLMEASQFESIWQGVALVLSKNMKQIPANLRVTQEDVSVGESHEALNAFVGRGEVHTGVGPDEF